jgi:hypothetical protein
MRLFAMLFAGLLAGTGSSYAATVSITCHPIANNEPNTQIKNTIGLPLKSIPLDASAYFPITITKDASSQTISSAAMPDHKFVYGRDVKK